MESEYKRLLIAIVVQSIKDYAYSDYEQRQDVLRWVRQRNSMFEICASAMGLDRQTFYEFMSRKLEAIDQGEGIFVQTKRDSGQRFLSHRVLS